jgi:phytoene dehydrogenase-like protein
VETWDVIVVGAGAAGMTAACVAAAEGRSVLLLEQASVVGGTTAISGGMVFEGPGLAIEIDWVAVDKYAVRP